MIYMEEKIIADRNYPYIPNVTKLLPLYGFPVRDEYYAGILERKDIEYLLPSGSGNSLYQSDLEMGYMRCDIVTKDSTFKHAVTIRIGIEGKYDFYIIEEFLIDEVERSLDILMSRYSKNEQG